VSTVIKPVRLDNGPEAFTTGLEPGTPLPLLPLILLLTRTECTPPISTLHWPPWIDDSRGGFDTTGHDKTEGPDRQLTNTSSGRMLLPLVQLAPHLVLSLK
jgi:hypothetical protein